MGSSKEKENFFDLAEHTESIDVDYKETFKKAARQRLPSAKYTDDEEG